MSSKRKVIYQTSSKTPIKPSKATVYVPKNPEPSDICSLLSNDLESYLDTDFEDISVCSDIR